MKNNILSLLTLLLFLALGAPLSVLAQPNQDLRLANQYYQKGDYEKAAILYKRLFEANPNRTHYYRSYYKTLIELKRFGEAKSVVEQQMVKRKNDPTLYIDMGLLYRNQELPDKAKEQFELALSRVKSPQIRSLASTFNGIDEYDYSIKTYLKGKELEKNNKLYAYELALAYKKKGEFKPMLTSYLDYAELNPRNIQTVKNSIQKIIANEDHMEEFQRQLYTRIQKDSENAALPQLLIWTFEQQKDYESALEQVIALDTRFDENGEQLMDLAQRATIEQQYDVAIQAYEAVIDKGEDSDLYLNAKTAILNCRQQKITKTGEYTDEDVSKLEKDYQDFLENTGRNPVTATTMRELSHLYTYYIYDLNASIKLLHEILDMKAANPHLKAESKLDLGDCYLMKGEIWEATLLYSQVDKAYRDDIIGELARFKNAKLSYYHGDFEWSQAQLDVLKASTSELIANDALELSVFIADNMGLDTTTTPMKMFARADLFIFQNKLDRSFLTLDSINLKYPEHALEDDILFTRAKIEIQKKNFEKAVEHLTTITEKFGEDLRADDAVFLLAQIHQEEFDKADQAMEYYQTLIIDYPGSLYSVEARKQYRKLRGDIFN